jgi:hypothetical protein
VTLLPAPIALPTVTPETAMAAGAGAGAGADVGAGAGATFGSSFLPQAASASAVETSSVNRILVFIVRFLWSGAASLGRDLQLLARVDLSGSLRMSLLAWKIRFQSFALPYSRFAIFDRLSPDTTT